MPRPGGAGGDDRGALARRLSWSVGDQALSSASNFALTVVVAREVSTTRFGTFALVLSVYFLVLGAMRAVVAEPFAVSVGRGEPARRSDALGAAAGIGGLALPLIAVAALLVGDSRTALLLVAVGLPVLLAQDAGRCLLLATGRARTAFAADLIWVVLQAVGLVAVAVTVGIGVESAIGVWIAGAAGSTIFALTGLRSAPRPDGLVRWLRDQRPLWPAFLVEHLAMMGSWQVAILVLGLVAGLADVAAVRGAQTLLGPVNMVYLMMPFLFIGEMASRRGHRDARRGTLWSMARRLALVLFAIGVGATVVLLLVPDDLGRAFLGDTWDAAAGALVPMGIYVSVTGLNLAALIGLRALAAVERSRAVRLTAASLLLTLTTIGAAWHGATGFAIGAAIATMAATALWWSALRSALAVSTPTDA